MHRRLVWLLVLALTAVAAAAVAGGATARGHEAAAKPRAATRSVDLATYPARRWIVQLRDAPLATYRGGVRGFAATAASAAGTARLNMASGASRAYVSHLQSAQRRFAVRLHRLIPAARVGRTYQVVLNGLAVTMSRQQAARVRRLAGVRSVTPDVPYKLQMFSTPAQIGAPTLWAQVGGQGNAGAGVNVAVIDSGIFVRYDKDGSYAGNPCFSDAGYTAPKGYPKGEKKYTNNKVIVARAYFRPYDGPIKGEDTPIQGTNQASPHGTHTAGTVACNAGTPVIFQGAHVTISGIAPRAYLMNYRVFYPSKSPEDFQNGNAYTVELVKATEDAVKDGADVISNSWGSTYQNTLAWPDPMIQAAEAAVDAGVVMVYSEGNAGPDTATSGSPAISPKVIGVGAVTKNATIVPGLVSVTAPTPVPANLTNLAVGPAGFGAQLTTQLGPAPYKPGNAGNTLGCNAFPAGYFAGQIALIARGTCEFSTKVLNAQNAGAIAAFIYNSAAGGDNLQSMGPGAVASQVTIPSWFLRRSDGLNMLAYYNANPGTAQAKFVYAPQSAPNIGDVMAGFSSRGPSQDKLLKPDVVAPGVDVLSSGYGDGDYPGPFTGFGSVSGTSMAAPHVAGSAALLRQLHPSWTPAQVKSALMTTATENVYLNTTQTLLAGVLDRGAGRIDLTKAGSPGLTLDQPSLSAGELRAGQGVDFTVRATDVGGAGTWTVSTAAEPGLTIAPDSASLTVPSGGTGTLGVQVGTAAGAAAGDYEGKVVLTKGGQQLHVPVWLRVLPSGPTKDVLLVDDDGSDAGFTDYRSYYTDTLDALGLTYDVSDPWNEGFVSFYDLFDYRAVLIFTGDNDSFDTSGFFPSDQDTLSEWLDSGGRLWTAGQNFAEESDSNASFASEHLGRARLYHGYLGLEYVRGSTYPGAAPRPTADGKGPLKGMKLDLSQGGDGAGNQSSIELAKPLGDNDTYQAEQTMTALFKAHDAKEAGDHAAIAFGRSSEPSLKERQEYRYRSVSMGFGLEGVNSDTGFATRDQVARATWRWLVDAIGFGPLSAAPKNGKPDHVVLTATPSSSVGASFTKFRWDFGDGGGFQDTNKPTTEHHYKAPGDYTVRLEVTDDLGHRAVQTQTIHISG